MSSKHHHAEWLSLVEVSGPFLSMPVLERVFRQGLDAHDPEHFSHLRLAFDEWEENQSGHRPSPAIHKAWIDFVLKQTLGLPDEVLAEGQTISQTLKATIAEHGEVLRPDAVVQNPEGVANAGKARLLIQTYPLDQNLEKAVAGKHWKASPATRMMELLHATDVRLGLVTNGERWMLVDAPKGDTTGFASWYATLWFEENVTLRAFRTLLGVSRFFSVADDETLEAMLHESAKNQQEVTDQLGLQVRRAVEVLIQSLDRADQDHGRALLADVPETVLYEAALTVMMRLVFLFSAEERELLLLGDPLFDQHYAVSTLVAQLQEAADQHGEEVLERRLDAWVRLLSTFRAVYGGVRHERMKLIPYAGNLFNPDRFPFLEGRGTTNHTNHTNTKAEAKAVSGFDSFDSLDSWLTAPANPLPVNNRTVLHLLRSLQYLQMQGEARRLSFRALDIEQIGHVYEGLLDHTAKRAPEPMLGLAGAKGTEPEVPLSKLEELTTESQRAQRKTEESTKLLTYLKEVTGRSESALKKSLSLLCDLSDSVVRSSLRAVCGNDDALFQRVRPFSGLLRNDTFDRPVVIRKGSVFVTEGTDRRSSGTHYTPRSLTEPIVQYTLEPLVYVGPAEGMPKEEWKLRPAKELLELKICDMACGSGAFLVQACRYLSERLVEAWETTTNNTKNTNKDRQNTYYLDPSSGDARSFSSDSFDSCYSWLLPLDSFEQLVIARRLIAQRCLYGVDKNPLAVEMAKLSLWLLTLAKDKPFEFLDHAIRRGDSLVGINNIEQLRSYSLQPDEPNTIKFSGPLDDAVDEAISLRLKLEGLPSNTVEDVERQEQLLKEANDKIARLRCAADLLVAGEFWGENPKDKAERVRHNAVRSGHYVENGPTEEFERAAAKERKGQLMFHWPLEFPEVIVKRGGFDAIVGNPPFMGGQKITGSIGTAYRDYLVGQLAGGQRGSADLCAYFLLRAGALVRAAGGSGFITTNTIAQGDTREVGLDQLTAGGAIIPRAVASQPWPGAASLEVSLLWLRAATWAGGFDLDGKSAAGITPFLTVPNAVTGKPHRLKANEGKSFQGSIVLGMGFVLTPDEAAALIARDARNKDVLFPYLNGEDLNSRPDQSPSRWVINFFDWPEEKARTYPDCFRIIEDKVKPERISKQKNPTDRDRAKHWWRYGRHTPALYKAIAGLERVLVRSRIADKHSMESVPAGWVNNEKVVIFPGVSFTVMQSNIHEAWARNYSSSLRTDMQYTPSDCFETFPFPDSSDSCDSWLTHLGERYHAHRQSIMQSTGLGLTKTYNRFHNPDETSADIQRLRELHVEMDRAVADAYGWTDLDLGHDFHETKQGVRFTISEAARREVLERLLKLNHERYAAEVKQGLHEKKRTTNRTNKTNKGKKKASDEGGGLFE